MPARSPRSFMGSVSYIGKPQHAGLCYPCPRTDLSPISPVRTKFPLDSVPRGQSPHVGSAWWRRAQRSTEAGRFRRSGCVAKNVDRAAIAARRASPVAPKLGCRVAPAEGGLAMDTLELDRLGDEIAELSAHLDAATARLLDLIREFDVRDGWNTGFSSCAAWLAWRVGFAPGAAREHVRVARALGTLPLLSDALARGELSYAKVRELTRVATPETEERLLAVGRAGTAAHVERIVRGWRRMDRKAQAREADRHHTARALHVYQDEDGTVRIRGRLAPEVGALLVKALEGARESLYQRRREEVPDADPPTMEQQQADALALLAETALRQGIDPGAPGDPYQVVVHVDAAVRVDADQTGPSVLEDGMRRP